MEGLVKTYDNPVRVSEWFSRYDALGNRIQKAQGTSITKYIVDPNRSLPSVIAEADASGTIAAYYVYGLGLVSRIVGSNAYFYQYDGLGSTVAITDKTGAVKNKYAYDDFGNVAKNSTEAISNPFKYVGRFGVATDLPDLLYMRARYYSPSIGRFINKDPIGLAGGLNMYGYVGNNPLMWIDPLGLSGRKVTARIISTTGIVISGISLFIPNPMLTAVGISLSLHGMLIEPSRPIGLILGASGLVVGATGVIVGNPFLVSLGLSLSIHGFLLDLPPSVDSDITCNTR